MSIDDRKAKTSFEIEKSQLILLLSRKWLFNILSFFSKER